VVAVLFFHNLGKKVQWKVNKNVQTILKIKWKY